MINFSSLVHRFDPETGKVDGIQGTSRHLADLREATNETLAELAAIGPGSG